jgi:Citrate synthase, C-terminal domain
VTIAPTSAPSTVDGGIPHDFVPGLAGVLAFTTEIAEPDRDGGALRYRGVNIEDLVAERVEFGDVWALLVDGKFGDGLPLAEPLELPVHTRDVMADAQAGLAMLGSMWRFRPLLDIDDQTAREQLARASAMALSFVAQSARGIYQPAVPQSAIDKCATAAGQFMTRWKGDPDPRHIEAIDAYWVSAAEHGMNASTFTARVIASTGADVTASLSGAIGAMSGPLHGGAPARVLPMIHEVGRTGDANGLVKGRPRHHRCRRQQAITRQLQDAIQRPSTHNFDDGRPITPVHRRAQRLDGVLVPIAPGANRNDLQRRGTPQVLEDQRRLRAGHVGVGVEVFHHEGPQIVGVACGDVQDEVVGAGEKIDVHHLRLAPDLLDEVADLAAGV